MGFIHRKSRFRFLIWLVPLLVAWLAVREVPLAEVVHLLAGLEIPQLLGLVLLNAAIFLLITGRWWLILKAQGYQVPFLPLAGYRLAGFGLTYLTPGPQMGGEPLQVYLVRRRHGVPTVAAIAAVTLDKLMELQANFAFLVLGAALILRQGLFGEQLSKGSLLVLVGLVLLPAGYLLLLGLGGRPVASLATWIARRFHDRPFSARFQRGAASAEDQVADFLTRRPLATLAALLLSLLIWASMLAEFWVTLRFLGLTLDLTGAIILLTSARIAFLLPSPAGAGTLEAALILSAEILGLPPSAAIGLSLLIRARDLSLAGLGLYLGTTLSRPGPVEPLPQQAGD